MRQWMPLQMMLGQKSIERLEFNARCRDDIPALLAGLKMLYMNPELRTRILALLEKCIGANGSLDHGRPGMDLWRILVLGVLRLGAELDYDRLHDLANEHRSVRVMLMSGGWEQGEKWTVETIKDNVSLLTPEILDQISQVVVQAGHTFLKKNCEEELELKGRCDSFVVKTDVHYPTDISLLLDALRVVIRLMIRLSRFDPITGWRQGNHLYKKLKKLVREIGRMKKLIRDSKGRESKDPKRAEQKRKELERKQQEVLGLHREVLKLAQGIVSRAEADLKVCQPHTNKEKAEEFLGHAKRQIDQIRRRVLQGATIPAEEKVYSVFEPHTDWICKGKAGVPQELGVMVSILEDQHGFVLHHRVMQKQTDSEVAVPIVKEAKSRFPNLKSCSFDKGYHSPENQDELSKILDEVILPKKGKLGEARLEVETSESFVNARNRHSAVESGINCLEHHGLSRCLDHGIDGFKRCVSLAVLSKNIYLLGRLIIDKERKRQRASVLALAAA
jgi:transposase, IS5 family